VKDGIFRLLFVGIMLTARLDSQVGRLVLGLLAGALAATACGTKDKAPSFSTTGSGNVAARPGFANGGTGADKGSGGTAGGSGEGGEAGETGHTGTTGGSSGAGGSGTMPAADAPEVHVTSPAAVTNPNDPAVLVADKVDVLCTATKSKARGAADVDEATVVLAMLDAHGTVIESFPGTKTGNANEYTAEFLTLKVADNGVISFTCQASDTSSPPLVGMDQSDTFIDHGPTITAVKPPVPAAPPAGSTDPVPFATSVTQALDVAFTVDEAPVAKGDKGAAVDKVSLTVGGKQFDLTPTNGQYTATVHLDDPKIFNPIPDGDQKIVITASDKRQPQPAEAEFTYDFIVDGTGPDITITSPQSGDIEAGKVEFTFVVKDSQSGVDVGSTTVIINQKPYTYDPKDPSSWSYASDTGTFTFSFDTTQIKNSVAQATVSVKAFDSVGNESDAKDVLIWLDNVPPIIDLDPMPVREIKDDNKTCSLAFDPVGPAAANDLQVVHTFRTFRAIVWDETNVGADQPILHAAAVDPNSVYLLLQPHPEQGLLKDTTGDGTCDALVTTDHDTGQDLPNVQLLPVTPQGSSWFGSADAEDPTLLGEFPMPLVGPADMPVPCQYGNSSSPPDPLCTGKVSDLTRVIQWDLDAQVQVPAVFALPKLQDESCTGDAWEIGAFLDADGWICAAVMAKDNVGNMGISFPLRLCYDDQVGAPPPCTDPSSSPPPSCAADDCSMPPRFGPALLKQ
jgi:hypothetical protein